MTVSIEGRITGIMPATELMINRTIVKIAATVQVMGLIAVQITGRISEEIQLTVQMTALMIDKIGASYY